MKNQFLDTIGAWLLALIWILPLAYTIWAACHPAEYAIHFNVTAPLTFDNFITAWNAAPFARYFLNTFLLVTLILVMQFILSTLAAYAFARLDFWGKDVLFFLVLLQLIIMPEILIVENYRTMSFLGLRDTIFSIGLPYFASAFGIFLLRQTFKTVPKELEEAAYIEGANMLQILLKVFVPLAKVLAPLFNVLIPFNTSLELLDKVFVPLTNCFEPDASFDEPFFNVSTLVFNILTPALILFNSSVLVSNSSTPALTIALELVNLEPESANKSTIV